MYYPCYCHNIKHCAFYVLAQDDPDFSDTKVLEDYRAARLRQIQQERARNRFGDVVEIIKDEWISQVTEGSKAGYWVIVHLYQDSVIECRLVEEALQQLAPKFKYIKFLKIRSTQAIENWPERNLPTIFAYKNGSMQRQLLTLKEVGGKTMKPADLEWWLVQKDIVTTSELEEDPRETVDFQEGNKGKLSKASRYAQERNYNDEDD